MNTVKKYPKHTKVSTK